MVAAAAEVLLIRPLYGRPVGQILVTIGLDLALVGLLEGGFGSDSRSIAVPGWLSAVAVVGGERIPNGDWLSLGPGLAVLGALTWFLRRTRYGMIIRAGAENRDMVRALGIDVGRAFTIVFAVGGAAAGLAGLLNSVVFSGALVNPTQGDQLLIFAFIVVVIGGLGSVTGSAIAATGVGLIQVYVTFYAVRRPGAARERVGRAGAGDRAPRAPARPAREGGMTTPQDAMTSVLGGRRNGRSAPQSRLRDGQRRGRAAVRRPPWWWSRSSR